MVFIVKLQLLPVLLHLNLLEHLLVGCFFFDYTQGLCIGSLRPAWLTLSLYKLALVQISVS